MGQFEMIKRNGEVVPFFSKEPFCTLKSATQNTTLMGDDNVQLSIVSSQLIDFSKGDKIIVDGQEYTIRTKVNREMISDEHYQYDATFYGVMYELMKSLYRDTDANGKSTKSTFDLTYTIDGFMRVLIYNVSRDYPGLWAFDEANCPDTEPRTINFANHNCLQALQTLCSSDQFNLEFRITQADGVRTIHIGKFGDRVVPPGGKDYFEWGKGNGLYTLKEQKVDDKSIITRLWVEGGTTNIRKDYRDYSERLQLPYPRRLNKNKHTLADGTVVEAGTEMIGIDDDNKRYIEDGDLRDMLGSDEDVKQYNDIYPKRTGVVTALVEDDINSFVDDTMDFDLCETDDEGNTKYLIAGNTAKITFISGRLAGQEFELNADGGYDHATKRFTIIPYTDTRGLTIPTTDSDAFRIAEGDQYKITDINLPTSYEENAEEELWYTGMDDFKPMTQARAQYVLTFDRSYFLENLPDDSSTCVFQVGDYVPVKDERFGIEHGIRIQRMSRNLLSEHDYSLTLSDTTTISVLTQTVVDVQKQGQLIEINRVRDLNLARRGWRTTEELRKMVYDTDGYFDPENIRPNSIDTNMLTVGSKSQQFVLIDVVLEANVNGLPNRFNASAGVLAHLTIDEDAVRYWSMASAEFTLASTGGFYLFAKCSKTGSNGTWYLTQKQMKFEPTDDPNNYYFQVGILSSLRSDDNFRDFVTTYGFTRINGNTITTGKIVTSDGQCYLDLDGNQFRVGDANSSLSWANGQLILKGTLVQSQSGDLSNIGVYRGTYNSQYVYYKGDEVDYTHNGETCTYRYINNNPSAGIVPTNSTYWAVVAKGASGEQGEAGLSVFYTFHDSQEQPSTPTGDGTTGGWHMDSTESVIWMSIKNAKDISSGTWGTPFRVRGADGTSITILGTKTSVSELPVTGIDTGDAYIIDGNLYVWDGTNWTNVGKIQGDAGKSSYLHMKYSDDGGQTFTAGNGETPGRWMGFYVDQSSVDSDDPKKYKWNDTKGEKGTPGEPGEDGRTTYLHIKYSDNGGLSFTGNNGEDPGDYIGQYTDFEEMDSDDPTMYTWSKIKGDSGSSGTDAAAGEYYEYRYAKNGSTTVPPDLDITAANPTGWSTVMPTLDDLEYMWCTMAKKSGLSDKTTVHIPVNEAEAGGSVVSDTKGGYNGTLSDGGSVVKDGSRYAMDLSGNGECSIPYDLPYGDSFTLCFWFKTNQTSVKWMYNGYYGRSYVEKTIALAANTWTHLAFRFNDRTVFVFKDGELLHSGSINEHPVGFSLYDDNMFGSDCYFDEVRLLSGALPQSDIAKVMNGTVDTLVSNWCVPYRVSPYDGKDGEAISIKNVDVEYAISTSNTTAPTTGWTTDAPAWENGKYIWSRTKIYYTDDTSETTKAACITGGVGATGADGNGVSSIVEQYYLSSSATSLLNGEWSTTRPTWKDGWYIWTRSVITYTNGTSTTTAAICVTGGKGATGTGVSGVTEYYLTSNSSSGITTSTSGWSTSVKSPTSSSKYLWNYERVTYTNGESVNTTPHIIGMYSADGIDGTDGRGISSVTEYYARSTSNSTAPTSWSTTPPTLTATYKYLWNYTKINYDDNSSEITKPLVIGVYGDKGDKGDKGEKGDSPALVYRGTYDSSATYYGNANRVDCVKYNGVYYVARVDAGTFSGKIPTNTTYWNTFGATFESVATQLLLAENANIAGWVFRNNRLEAQNGSVYLDGVNGVVRLKGTLQLSTAYQGNLSDSNIFYLPAITSNTNITMGYELEDIGKVCHLFNSSPFGGATYNVYCYTFGMTEDGASRDATFGTVIASVKPQEHVELVCFELKPKSLYSSSFGKYMDICAKWNIVSRYGYDNYRSAYAQGRFPTIMAIMRLTGTNSGASLSGEFWNGKSISSVFTVSRKGEGYYKVSFASGLLPSGYKIMATGYGTARNESSPIKATVRTISTTYFEIYTSDDASRNDGSCDIVIFSPNWSYAQ